MRKRVCSIPDSIYQPEVRGLALGVSCAEASGEDQVAPLFLMSNLATGQNFTTEQGNQLITDTLPAVEYIQ